MKKEMKGKKFGKLTVIQEEGKSPKKGYRWRCKCDCGNETVVYGSHLRSGHTKSCGCYGREQSKKRENDLTGKRFGRLTALEPAVKENGKRGYWLCQCDCGKQVICYKENLCGGVTRSCGCLLEETRRNNMKKAIHFVEGTCLEKIVYSVRNPGKNNDQKGVYKRENGKWRATIGFKGKVYNLGTFSRYEDAVQARLAAEKQLYIPFLQAQGIQW